MLRILVVAMLAQARPEGWSEFPPHAAPAGAKATVKIGPAVVASPEAKERYRLAVAMIGRKEFAAATESLNRIAQEYPQWSAVFAARCTAQVGLQYPQNAVEDCTYALKLDPDSSSAVWWLAEAEAALGRREDAARHFRQYAGSTAPEVTASSRDWSVKRAAELEAPASRPTTAAVAAPPPASAPTIIVQPVLPGPRFGQPWSGSRAAPAGRRGMEGDVPCHSSLDCGSGEFCKDRGDRIRVCMGSGGRGASCTSSIDCGSGEFCKDRGDGFKVCM